MLVNTSSATKKYPKKGIDISLILDEFGTMEEKEERIEEPMNTIDKKHISKVLVELAEENLKCPDNRQYVSMSGVIKVKSKVQTQW